jgi:hypothetical protein
VLVASLGRSANKPQLRNQQSRQPLLLAVLPLPKQSSESTDILVTRRAPP